ncbi:MAG: hypothetical protein FWC23_01445 [Chitinispirillia bacterium]|nr:hypothetical protein [Chitinispirillia bacterium]MCL2219091.1 hypothetical protein [Chitinispirillia bacterium]MCL2267841.1 hypothetical protein [Chitinispirillia bacterium]
MNVRTEAEELERLRERARLNEASALAHERRQAKSRKSLEIAKNFKDNGVDVDTIARSTGLTVDDIQRL